MAVHKYLVQKYVTVHTGHGQVTLAFEDSGEAQRWFAALRDVVSNLAEVQPYDSFMPDTMCPLQTPAGVDWLSILLER